MERFQYREGMREGVSGREGDARKEEKREGDGGRE